MEASAWLCKEGSSLLVPSGPSGLHLFVIALGPLVLDDYGSAPQVLMVSATTLREGLPHDDACILEAGDHPFIQHRSYIAYRYARLDSASHVEKMVASQIWHPKEPCSTELLDRIITGFLRSRLVPREFRKLLQG